MIKCPNCERPVPDSLTLCQPCGDSVVSALLSVPQLYVELAVTRVGLGRLVAHANGRSAEPASPVRAARVCARCADPDHPDGPCGRCWRGVRLDGDQQLAALANMITTWARMFAEDMAACIFVDGPALVDLTERYRHAILDDKTGQPYWVDTPPDPGALSLVPLTPVEQAAVWLAQHAHAIRAHPTARELLRDVLRATAQIRRIIDRPRDLQHIGPCPHILDDGVPCGTALRAEPDANWVRCPTCTQLSDVAAVLRATLRGVEPLLFTIDEALTLLERVHEAPARGTVESWVSRRRLAPRAYRRSNGMIVRERTHRSDEAMFVLGDIRALRAAGRKPGAA